jgi:hypothetical protein
MDENQKSMTEIISELEVDDVKQEDLAWQCIEDVLHGLGKIEDDAFQHYEYHNRIYQEAEFYNPFASSKENIV